MFKSYLIKYPNTIEFVRDTEIFGKSPECVGIKAFNKFCAINDLVEGIYKIYLRDSLNEYKIIIRRFRRNNLLYNEIIDVKHKNERHNIIDNTGILKETVFL